MAPAALVLILAQSPGRWLPLAPHRKDVLPIHNRRRAPAGLVEDAGYPLEEHFATTGDGYVLGLFRIPRGAGGARSGSGSRSSSSAGDGGGAGAAAACRPPVLLLHGVLDSGAAWVLNQPDQSLGFILADAGYDVWLGAWWQPYGSPLQRAWRSVGRGWAALACRRSCCRSVLLRPPAHGLTRACLPPPLRRQQQGQHVQVRCSCSQCSGGPPNRNATACCARPGWLPICSAPTPPASCLPRARCRAAARSRNHTGLLPTQPAFWDFTWDEMAAYDVPAVVDYVLRASECELSPACPALPRSGPPLRPASLALHGGACCGRRAAALGGNRRRRLFIFAGLRCCPPAGGAGRLAFVGHSQGTTQMFAALASSPALRERLRCSWTKGAAAPGRAGGMR